MVAKIVSFINFKGGVGKTVSVVNIAGFLTTEHNKKILVVDVDPQASATIHLLSEERYCDEKKGIKVRTLYDVLEKYRISLSSEIELNDVIIKNAVRRGPPGITQLHLVPSDLRLIDADKEFISDVRILMLKRELESIVDVYDYILIDCPPNLSLLTRNALFASDSIIIPLIPDFLSTVGLRLLLKKLGEIGDEHKKMGKDPPKVRGILFTRVEQRVKLHQRRMFEVKDDLEKVGIPCFTYYVRNLVGVQEAAGEYMPLCCCTGVNIKEPAEDYRNVTKEFIKKMEG
ncbi:MAG: AAA family ATPase [Candidatus Bathyarchaeia archaeon]